MDDESSNDVIAMETEHSQASGSMVAEASSNIADKPLMQFFKRLILYKDLKSITMLTNPQLEDILCKEFNLNLASFHGLQVEIYVTILKKYIKEWPMWDDFLTITKELSQNFREDVFVNVLGKRYNNLKIYLKKNLDVARDFSAGHVAKMKVVEKIKLSGPDDSKGSVASDVVLEVNATRAQLNTLFYRQPRLAFNNTIFNVEDKAPPSQITLNTFSLEAILNWWSVRITISLQTSSIFITRETTHELEHFLVNRRRKDTKPAVIPTLNRKVQIKEAKKLKQVRKKQIIGCLELLKTTEDRPMEGMQTILECVQTDIDRLHVVAAPAQYRCYMSKHPYVRYLYSEVEAAQEPGSYDIQLKETISPMHQFAVGRLDIALEKSLPTQWLKVECVACDTSYSGENLATELKQHFDEYHQVEPDWQCTKCQKNFPMVNLAENWWSHHCEE